MTEVESRIERVIQERDRLLEQQPWLEGWLREAEFESEGHIARLASDVAWLRRERQGGRQGVGPRRFEAW